MKRGIIVFLAFIMVIPVFGQRGKRDEEEAPPAYVEGITYALPRAGVRIFVEAVVERFEPGPYADYAQQLLGIENAASNPSVEWKLKNISLESFSEPDPDQVHKAMGEGAFSVSLTPDGRLAGINSSVEIPVPSSVQTHRFIKAPQKKDGFSFAHFNDTPLYMQGDSTTNFRPVRVDDEQKAAEAAARIMECRLTRFHMAAGLMDEFHPDGTAYKVSLDELDKIEKDYLSLFVGRHTYQRETFSFDYVPSDATLGGGEVVFRFSEQKGILPASDLSGKPVMIQMKTEEELQNKYAARASSENPFAGKKGVYYCMPAMGKVEIVFELKTIAAARLVFPQFGETAPLPERLLQGDYRIEIHPETGAVKKVAPVGL